MTLEERVTQLEQDVMKLQRNNVPIVSKVDDTSNKVAQITPYTAVKTAYIGDTEITFDAVDEVTEVSISIQ